MGVSWGPAITNLSGYGATVRCVTTKTPAPQGATPEPPQGDPTPAPQGAPEQTAPTAPPTDPPEPQGDATDWKAEARKWETRAQRDAQTLADLKKQMQTLLTPEQVADQAQAAAAAAAQATTASQEALKLRVALEKGVPASMADRLIGSTREELEADAAVVLATMTAAAPPAPTPPPSRVPDAGAGTGRATTPKHDLNELLRIAAGVAG